MQDEDFYRTESYMRREADRQLLEAVATDTRRLDRIESKIDSLAETVIALARAEEKLLSLEEDKVHVHRSIERIHQKLEIHDIKLNDTSRFLNTSTKLLWILISSVIMAAIGIYFK
jgi:hypothetical protein